MQEGWREGQKGKTSPALPKTVGFSSSSSISILLRDHLGKSKHCKNVIIVLH